MPRNRPSSNLRPTSISPFAQQVDSTRNLLTAFSAVVVVQAPGPIKTIMNELVSITVSHSLVLRIAVLSFSLFQVMFSNFMPAYATDPAVQEWPAAVLAAVDTFLIRRPSFPRPKHYPRLVRLVAQVAAHAKGTNFFPSFVATPHVSFSFVDSVAATNAQPGHELQLDAHRESESFLILGPVILNSGNALTRSKCCPSIHPRTTLLALVPSLGRNCQVKPSLLISEYMSLQDMYFRLLLFVQLSLLLR